MGVPESGQIVAPGLSLLVACLVLTAGLLTCPVGGHEQALLDLLAATRHLVDYYRANYRDVNLDGIFGLRVLEGQATSLLQQSKWLDGEVQLFLRNLVQDSYNISQASLPFIERDDPEYYTNLAPIIQGPLLLAKPYRTIEARYQWDRSLKKPSSEFNEDSSDRCFMQMLERAGGGVPCNLSTDCLHMMTELGRTEYGVTHQILYTIVAEERGCMPQVNMFLRRSGVARDIAEFQRNLCTNILFESSTMIQKLRGEVKPFVQDLFMEQGFVCGILGFMEFLHVDWLRQILSWQKASGCYGKMKATTSADARPSYLDYQYLDSDDGDDQQRQAQQFQAAPLQQQRQGDLPESWINGPRDSHAFQNDAVVVQQPMGNKNVLFVERVNETSGKLQHIGAPRRLLVEKSMSGGCLSHKTGVAAGVLSQYLRFYLDPGPADYRELVQIDGRNRLLSPVPEQPPLAHRHSAQEAKDNEALLDMHAARGVQEGEDGDKIPGNRDEALGNVKRELDMALRHHGDERRYGDVEEQSQDYYSEDKDLRRQDRQEADADDDRAPHDRKKIEGADEGDEEGQYQDNYNVQDARELWQDGGDDPAQNNNNNKHLPLQQHNRDPWDAADEARDPDGGRRGDTNGFGDKDGYEADKDDFGYDNYMDSDSKDDARFDVRLGENINPKHQPMQAADNSQDRLADKYPYYDQDRPSVPAEVLEPFNILNSETRVKVGAAPQNQDFAARDSGVSVGTSYAIVLIIMLILLYYMNKFVRTRRILIKYH